MHLNLFQFNISGDMGLVPIPAKCFSIHSAERSPQLTLSSKEVQRREGNGGSAPQWSQRHGNGCGPSEHTSCENCLKDWTSRSNRSFKNGRTHVFCLHLAETARLFTVLRSILSVNTPNK